MLPEMGFRHQYFQTVYFPYVSLLLPLGQNIDKCITPKVTDKSDPGFPTIINATCLTLAGADPGFHVGGTRTPDPKGGVHPWPKRIEVMNHLRRGHRAEKMAYITM
jgi:hypothetical protein